MTTDLRYQRAIDADRRLRALANLVELIGAMHPEDRGGYLCRRCVWERDVLPLLTPLVGLERGINPQAAGRQKTLEESLASLQDRPPARHDLEAWLRTQDAYDAFSARLRELLDPDNEWDTYHGGGNQ